MRRVRDEARHRDVVYRSALTEVERLRALGHTVAFYGSREPTKVTFGTGQPTHRVRIIWPTEGTRHVTLRLMTECLVDGRWCGEHVTGAAPLVGDRFGMLLVVGRGRVRPGRREHFLTCQCDCGAIVDVYARHLRSRRKRSCGCSAHVHMWETWRKKGVRRATYEGMDSHRAEDAIWRKMLARCSDVNDKRFERYGGRGIKVCEAWAKSFFAFLSDVGPRPSKRHSIDRINNDGNYEPGNVRWATPREQASNKSNSRFVTVNGERITVSECARRANISPSVLFERLNRGWDIQQAMGTPAISQERSAS